MLPLRILCSTLSVLLTGMIVAPCAKADFGGSTATLFAAAPDGKLVVRLRPGVFDPKTNEPTPSIVSYYEYDAKQDTYKFSSRFELAGYPGNFMYLSNAGDLVVISLGEKEAIRLYLKNGTRKKSWTLADFLKDKEIKACAQTGSTTQWLEEGSFSDRTFQFRGPSRVIRALVPSFTVVRGANDKVSFSGTIDAESGKLTRD